MDANAAPAGSPPRPPVDVAPRKFVESVAHPRQRFSLAMPASRLKIVHLRDGLSRDRWQNCIR
jgi:hypothetical protein